MAIKTATPTPNDMPKPAKPSEATAVQHLDALLKRRQPTTEDQAAELWNEAEGIVDAYLESVNHHSAEGIPSSTELGEACFWLLYIVGGLANKDHTALVIQLLNPRSGVQMFQIAPKVAALKDEALAELESQAKAQQAKSLPPPTHADDDLF